MKTLLETLNVMGDVFLKGIGETLYMTLAATLFSYGIGLPAGVLLYITKPAGIRPMPIVNRVLGAVVNLARSVPFLILMMAITPFTRAIVGTSIGSTAAIVPLVVAAAPFVARIVESSLMEVQPGIIEAARSMGSSNFEIIYKALLPEAKPSLLSGATIAVTTILGYSAMAGSVGGGGLGVIAYNYGYLRYRSDVMLITVVLLVIIVQILQEIGIRVVKKVDKRN